MIVAQAVQVVSLTKDKHKLLPVLRSIGTTCFILHKSVRIIDSATIQLIRAMIAKAQ
jgi:hypothetical protein